MGEGAKAHPAETSQQLPSPPQRRCDITPSSQVTVVTVCHPPSLPELFKPPRLIISQETCLVEAIKRPSAPSPSSPSFTINLV